MSLLTFKLLPLDLGPRMGLNKNANTLSHPRLTHKLITVGGTTCGTT